MTSYSLHFKGRELGETDELSTLGDALTEKPVLVMKEVPYTEHSARMHVRRLRGTQRESHFAKRPQSCLSAW